MGIGNWVLGIGNHRLLGRLRLGNDNSVLF
jgi:hypothetical protein